MMPLSEKQWQAFSEAFIYREVPKRHLLTAVGSIAREAYFINKGAGRLYFIKDGEEISANFMFEGGFITSLESFLLQIPSRQAVETLEDSELENGFAVETYGVEHLAPRLRLLRLRQKNQLMIWQQ